MLHVGRVPARRRTSAATFSGVFRSQQVHTTTTRIGVDVGCIVPYWEQDEGVVGTV